MCCVTLHGAGASYLSSSSVACCHAHALRSFVFVQVYLLNKRFKQQQEIVWRGKGGVQDRTIYEDSVFARMLRDAGLMEQRDYATYLSLFQHMSNFMKKPNLIVHLDVSPEESLRRIQMRCAFT